MKEITLQKVAYGDGDFRITLEIDGKLVKEFDTPCYCERYHDETVCEEEYDDDELDAFIEELLDMADTITDAERIIIESITRPLGRCYGNSYWDGVDFEKYGETWNATTYRGSNTWQVWSDVGMTGRITDADVEVSEDFVKNTFRDVVERLSGWSGFDTEFESELNEEASLMADFNACYNDISSILWILREMDMDYTKYDPISIYDCEDMETIDIPDMKLNPEIKEKYIQKMEWEDIDEDIIEAFSRSKDINDFLNRIE